jgi:histidinol-phosphatase
MSRDFLCDLDLALRLADCADAVSLKWFQRGGESKLKLDGSPVTAADLEIERTLRKIIKRKSPFDLIYGEEFSDHSHQFTLDSPTWVIDPIDHTRHFARGDPNYGTLVALIVEGVVCVGVVSAPSMGYRWWASRGGGAWVNGNQMSVSSTDQIAKAHVAIAGHREWVGRYHWPTTERLMNDVAYACGTEGGFLPAMKVASSQLDAFAEPWGSLWDHAALDLIVNEAGGSATTFDGGIARGGTLLVSNRLLHDRLLNYFQDIALGAGNEY